MITFGLPRTAGEFPGNCGAVHAETAGNFRFICAPLVQGLDLNAVIDCLMSVMCYQGSATLQGVF